MANPRNVNFFHDDEVKYAGLTMACKLTNFFLKPPVPVNIAVNAIAFGFAIKALEPASRVYYDLGNGNLTNGGYAVTGILMTLIFAQICLSCIMVFIDLEDRNNIRAFKLLAFHDSRERHFPFLNLHYNSYGGGEKVLPVMYP